MLECWNTDEISHITVNTWFTKGVSNCQLRCCERPCNIHRQWVLGVLQICCGCWFPVNILPGGCRASAWFLEFNCSISCVTVCEYIFCTCILVLYVSIGIGLLVLNLLFIFVCIILSQRKFGYKAIAWATITVAVDNDCQISVCYNIPIP